MKFKNIIHDLKYVWDENYIPNTLKKDLSDKQFISLYEFCVDKGMFNYEDYAFCFLNYKHLSEDLLDKMFKYSTNMFMFDDLNYLLLRNKNANIYFNFCRKIKILPLRCRDTFNPDNYISEFILENLLKFCVDTKYANIKNKFNFNISLTNYIINQKHQDKYTTNISNIILKNKIPKLSSYLLLQEHQYKISLNTLYRILKDERYSEFQDIIIKHIAKEKGLSSFM